MYVCVASCGGTDAGVMWGELVDRFDGNELTVFGP